MPLAVLVIMSRERVAGVVIGLALMAVNHRWTANTRLVVKIATLTLGDGLGRVDLVGLALVGLGMLSIAGVI